jgi:chemotaxis signal transduction protein
MHGVLVFLAAGERLAVAVGDVLRLVVEGPITPIPFGHRALAGVMRVDDSDAVLPVFDLRGLREAEPAPPPHVDGATIAIIPTSIGPIGFRLDRLLGSAASYIAVDEATPAPVVGVVDGAGRADVVGASLEVGPAPFFFLSIDAFIHAVGLSRRERPWRARV